MSVTNIRVAAKMLVIAEAFDREGDLDSATKFDVLANRIMTNDLGMMERVSFGEGPDYVKTGFGQTPTQPYAPSFGPPSSYWDAPSNVQPVAPGVSGDLTRDFSNRLWELERRHAIGRAGSQSEAAQARQALIQEADSQGVDLSGVKIDPYAPNPFVETPVSPAAPVEGAGDIQPAPAEDAVAAPRTFGETTPREMLQGARDAAGNLIEKVKDAGGAVKAAPGQAAEAAKGAINTAADTPFSEMGKPFQQGTQTMTDFINQQRGNVGGRIMRQENLGFPNAENIGSGQNLPAAPGTAMPSDAVDIAPQDFSINAPKLTRGGPGGVGASSFETEVGGLTNAPAPVAGVADAAGGAAENVSKLRGLYNTVGNTDLGEAAAQGVGQFATKYLPTFTEAAGNATEALGAIPGMAQVGSVAGAVGNVAAKAAPWLAGAVELGKRAPVGDMMAANRGQQAVTEQRQKFMTPEKIQQLQAEEATTGQNPLQWMGGAFKDYYTGPKANENMNDISSAILNTATLGGYGGWGLMGENSPEALLGGKEAAQAQDRMNQQQAAPQQPAAAQPMPAQAPAAPAAQQPAQAPAAQQPPAQAAWSQQQMQQHIQQKQQQIASLSQNPQNAAQVQQLQREVQYLQQFPTTA